MAAADALLNLEQHMKRRTKGMLEQCQIEAKQALIQAITKERDRYHLVSHAKEQARLKQELLEFSELL